MIIEEKDLDKMDGFHYLTKKMVYTPCISNHCVSCGKAIEYSKNNLPNHHCSKSHINNKEGANKRAEEVMIRNKKYGEKIADGFAMMDQDFYK